MCKLIIACIIIGGGILAAASAFTGLIKIEPRIKNIILNILF